MSSSSTTAELPEQKLPLSWPEDAKLRQYKGGCHCGKIVFEFEHPEITRSMACNCSFCLKRGMNNIFTWDENFRFTKGSFEEMTPYRFASQRATIYSCPTCSCGVLSKGPGIVGIGIYQVEGVDPSSLTKVLYDGAKMPVINT